MKQTTMNADFSVKNRKWYTVDATDQVLGRLATQVANLLRGTDKTNFLPYKDCGDYVLVTNCEKIRLTGNKLEQKNYYRHSGYIGGLTTTSAKKMLEKKPQHLIFAAVKNMLQKNKLADQQIKKLFIYEGNHHGHEAQKPIKFKLKIT